MSVQNPLRLLDLAGMSLLRDEASTITALKDLPTELFPPVFMEAFYGRCSETLKAMVQAWPFVRLPLGGLMKMPHLGTLQAVLDGLDILLAQKDHPRRCKLRVLDLRNTSQDFWRMWSGYRVHGCSSSLMAQVAEDRSRTKQPGAPLEVFIELHLKERTLDGFLTYLIRWVEQRKASIHLCCKKLRILSFPMENIMKVLSMVQLDCIQEVQVNCTWHLSTLAVFAPLLGQMNKVQRLLLSNIHMSALGGQEQQHFVQITSQFLRLHHLRDLHLESHSFLEGCLDQMLRCLTNPLDNLAITHCLLSDSDLSHLSQCPNISQLKGLDLSGITLTYSSPELLPVLLEKVAATLQELYLEQCGIMDSHLETILLPLSRCSQLMFFSLRGNVISMAVMEKLLRHTSGLPSLSQELYPVPQESYSSQRILQPGRLAQCRAELFEILRVLGRPRIIWISSSPRLHCGDDTFSHPQPIVYR
ncbi:PRAME family member 12-like [Lagenorhynchus albirostris]|uniref:PRAME family member 12-like n=1 Tax=Lagenorhynchus albirostris TaxID=27610 RepID=UPI0028F04973|nr:PRAME family member 12-like [Lagenorhynchus albirostris]